MAVWVIREEGNRPFQIKRLRVLASSFSPFFLLFNYASCQSGYIPLEFSHDYMEGGFFPKNVEHDASREREGFSLEMFKEGNDFFLVVY